MSFFQEYKKMLTCLVFLIILLSIQYYTNNDLSQFISSVIDGMIVLLFGGAVKFSVLKTSERQLLNGDTPGVKKDSDYSDPVPVEMFNPGLTKKTDQ